MPAGGGASKTNQYALSELVLHALNTAVTIRYGKFILD